ncbi:photosynthetic reaction center cytochrome PufC [Rubrivivax gelatinosus]|uniref:Photosynthetic reaction center cytochrome c subunit n=1 Tax=Rubrivivax gelatinosus TaxID=28068 RepID=A0ABS1DPT1_RUBGE|nr:photosynthetic reaction center cytochrome PufC [Rubrivivax gelatinosus]MBK1711746.1 photosynthetic reaction center cytochrome c subunit [Rubrivivax gelatinosus]
MALAVRISTLTVAVTAAALLAGCERPPVDSVQRGYRGTGMQHIVNPRTLAEQIPLNQAPAGTPVADDSGPRAGQVFQNVKVLGHLSVAEFTRHMAAITQWVAPTEGCTYCHTDNLADDSKYQKVVSRRMIEMTQKVNAQWTQHVAATGVTCYTCHRGQPVPKEIWFKAEAQNKRADFIGNLDGQNQAKKVVGLTSLPYDPFSTFLKDDTQVRVYGTTALPTGTTTAGIKQAEKTYGLMMHMAGALGVNCTYCHNTNGFGSWDNAAPQRATAWYGIRLARDLNNGFMEGLTKTFPAHRLGPTGDVAKINCATCHQGAYKPIYGAQMAKDYVGLKGPAPAAAAAAAVATPVDAAASEPVATVATATK